MVNFGPLPFPVLGCGWSAPRLAELQEPFEGFGDAAACVEVGGQVLLAWKEAVVALPQERLGFGKSPLARQTGAQEAEEVNTVSGVGPECLRALSGLPQERLGLRPLPLRQSHRSRLGQHRQVGHRIRVRLATQGVQGHGTE